MVAYVWASLFSGVAAAQQQAQPSASEIALAREIFGRGVAAAEAARWDEALEHFTRAYSLWPQPTVLFNLAGAQERTGRFVAATESYRRFLREATSGNAARFRPEAEAGLARMEPKIGRVRIVARDMDIDDQLLLDGTVLSRAVIGTEMPIDPGAHTIAVRRGQTTLVSAEVTIGEGERRAEPVELVVPRRPDLPPSNGSRRIGVGTGDPDDDPIDLGGDTTARGDGGGSIFASPWFWIATVVVIGGAITAVLVFQPSDSEPYEGNLGPGHLVIP